MVMPVIFSLITKLLQANTKQNLRTKIIWRKTEKFFFMDIMKDRI